MSLGKGRVVIEERLMMLCACVKAIRKTFRCMPALEVCVELVGDGGAVSVDVVGVGVDEGVEVIVGRCSVKEPFGEGSDAASVSKGGVMCCLFAKKFV